MNCVCVSDQEGNSHIVLSYHTVDKAAMLKVKQRLEAMGYNVWMLELEQATSKYTYIHIY